jgi:hypothetical protein
MVPRPSTRTEQSRVHQRPPDPAETARAPLEPKASGDPEPSSESPPDPHHGLTNPARDPDPTADSDPYEHDDREPDDAA